MIFGIKANDYHTQHNQQLQNKNKIMRSLHLKIDENETDKKLPTKHEHTNLLLIPGNVLNSKMDIS